MMFQKIQKALEQVRKDHISHRCNVKLLGATPLGIVTVDLSGECCSDRLTQLRTLLVIEDALKKLVPEVKVVLEDAVFYKCSYD